MIRSRSTLASTLAAATDEHFRSALIIVVTGGVDGQLDRAEPARRSGPRPRAGRARRGVRARGRPPGEPVVVAVEDHAGRARTRQLGQRAAAGQPQRGHDADRVDLVGLGVADGVGAGPAPQRGTIRSRAAGASSLESLTPAGAVRHVSSMTTTPTRDRPGERPAADLVHPARAAVALALQGPLDRAGRGLGRSGWHAAATSLSSPCDGPARSPVGRVPRGGTLANVAGRHRRASRPGRQRPDDDEGPADDVVDRDRARCSRCAVEAGVGGVGPVVAHDPHAPAGTVMSKACRSARRRA